MPITFPRLLLLTLLDCGLREEGKKLGLFYGYRIHFHRLSRVRLGEERMPSKKVSTRRGCTKHPIYRMHMTLRAAKSSRVLLSIQKEMLGSDAKSKRCGHQASRCSRTLVLSIAESRIFFNNLSLDYFEHVSYERAGTVNRDTTSSWIVPTPAKHGLTFFQPSNTYLSPIPCYPTCESTVCTSLSLPKAV